MASLWHWARKWAVWALGLTTALLLVAPVWRATLRVGNDYNEGWNALFAARWMSGGELYPAFDGLIGNNYPPLSFYAAGELGRWVGDDLFAGRLLAFLGLFAAAVAAGGIVKQLTGNTRAALLTGLLLPGYSAAVHPGYVGIDDPQWLGHGIMLLGLLTFIASRQRGWFFLVSAGLMLTAGFVKHLLLPVPMATTVWLLLYRRDALWRWLAICAVLLGSALGLCFAVYGDGFLEGVFLDNRGWSFGKATAVAAGWFITTLPLVALASLALRSAWRSLEGRLVVCYAAISAVLAVLVLGGAGIDQNAVFDVEISLILMLGLAIGTLEGGSAAASGWVLLLVLVLGVHLPRSLWAVRDLWRGSDRLREATTMIGLLAQRPGPVACEDLSLCYWAGKGFEIDFFLLGQKLNAGSVDPVAITARLRGRYYAAIQTNGNDGGSVRLPAGINREIADNYEVARTGPEGALLLPRRQ